MMTEAPWGHGGRIFISYRREDAGYPAGWLFDQLAARIGADHVFKDVDSIEPGDDFADVITEAVRSCEVLLAVIGDRWLTAADEDGRRLDDPGDFVRLEIEAALARGVRVIPVLVSGARMPRAEQLPASLSPLARRQAVELRHARFSSDLAGLLAVLDRALGQATARQPPPGRASPARTRPAAPRDVSAALPESITRFQDPSVAQAATPPTIDPALPTLLTTPGSAARRIENSELPAAIQVNETEHRVVARRLGAGVQVYDCDPARGTFRFREQQADLYDFQTVTQRGIHFVGPEPGTAQWADPDGSRVVTRVIAKVDAPSPADPAKDVPWLKVEAFQHFGTGVFSDVTFIQRILTHGGQAPPSCDSGTTTSRYYTALYIFWVAVAA